MNNTKGPIIALVVGIIAVVAVYFLTPVFRTQQQKDTSDARAIKTTVNIGGDNWAGYFILQSPRFTKMMRNMGIRINYVDDKANYVERFEKLEKGKYDLVVATVDSKILNSIDVNFPGTIISVIDESKGGDAIVSMDPKIQSLDDLKKVDCKIGFTPVSPTEHLIKSLASHFDVSKLKDKKGSWRVETNGSSEALEKLLKGEVSVAGLWQPDVAKALTAGAKKIIGTEDTEKLIVDILIAGREYSQDNEDVIQKIMANYFKALKYYHDNPGEFDDALASFAGVKKNQIADLKAGIHWVNMTENATQWFGIDNSVFVGLEDAINSTISILKSNGDVTSNPLPNQDPYRIMDSSYIKKLYKHGVSAGQFGAEQGQAEITNSLEKNFSELTDNQWGKLKEVGTLKVRPITFRPSSSDLNLKGREEVDKAVANLKHYPNYRIIIKGHTGTKGDPTLNKGLSQDRSDSVSRYIQVTYGVDANRIRSVGYGSEKKLDRKSGESYRAYNNRLLRVEIYLAAEVY